MYGLSAQDCFRVDDLLDFSNDDLFSSSSVDAADLHHHHHHHLPPPPPTTSSSFSFSAPTDFTNDLCVAVRSSDDAAELEWLSRFVDDSFSDFQNGENVAGAAAMFPNDASFSGRARSKRSRAPVSTVAGSWTEMRSKSKREISPPSEEAGGGGVRRCAHCASEKTPQWRTGPMGPKTLCNACGVRYKSGRLVPEYRPAASPTFMLTQHSNSHRKVLELRRQKELQRQHQQQPPPPPRSEQKKQEQFFPHHHGFRVC